MERERFEIFLKAAHGGEPVTGGVLGKAVVYLADRPGVLGELASMLGRRAINITLFHYDRSEHPNRVIIEARAGSAQEMREAFEELGTSGLDDPALREPCLELSLTDTSNMLNMEVGLEHRPGTLGSFARLLGEHGANVMHMSYNEDIAPASARFAMATAEAEEVDRLLRDMNEKGVDYSLLYTGARSQSMEHAIGLNLVEKFFFRLKDTLATEDVEKVKTLVNSSQKISQGLEKFAREAGRDLMAGSVFTNVLAFTSASLLHTGEAFTYTALPPVVRGSLTLHCFRLPTGGNVIVLEAPEGFVMVDGGYGIYYRDVKRMLGESGIEPSRIKRILLSHADSDHAGISGYFEREFGAGVWLHRCARRIITSSNRAEGSKTPYMELNRLFTVMTDGFTEASYPGDWKPYGTGEGLSLGGFPVIDSIELGGMDFFVLESLGGHVHGQVFLVSPEAGLMLTSDYLLDLKSLRPEEKEVLSVPRRMMVSTNVDSALFREEMGLLSTLALKLDEDTEHDVVIVPGHGGHYPARLLKK